MNTPSDYDLPRVRAAFPVLEREVYLNVGTWGIMPEPALTAYLEALAAFEREGVSTRVRFGESERQAREMTADLLGAAPEEIAFTRNATDGINLALSGMRWEEGDEAVSTAEEHEAMFHPLLWLQRTRGVKARFIEVSPDPRRFLASLTDAVTTSPSPAWSPTLPPSGRMVESLRAPELSATCRMVLMPIMRHLRGDARPLSPWPQLPRRASV